MGERDIIAIEPVVLEGRWLRLEPLALSHVDALYAAVDSPDIWRYLSDPFDTREDMDRWVRQTQFNRENGSEMPFVQIERSTGNAIGSTRLLDIRPEHRGVEIGYTWLSKRHWRSRMNSEAKYLLLRHLFETVGCIRVSLKTDLLNERSQRAIERLGAKREGVLRKHMVVLHGRVRDTVYYSVLDNEWPDVRRRMEDELYGSDAL